MLKINKHFFFELKTYPQPLSHSMHEAFEMKVHLRKLHMYIFQQFEVKFSLKLNVFHLTEISVNDNMKKYKRERRVEKVRELF